MSTVAHVDPRNPIPSALGYPTGCALWVVHQHDPDVLLPYGAEGELLIEGANVGRGYLSMPERTARSWIVPPVWTRSPHHDNSRRRFYLSGDICKFAEDGSVLFVRRKDTQVKLRGQRVSIHEVEMRLQKVLPGFAVVAEVVKWQSQDVDRSLLIGFAAEGDAEAKETKILPISDFESTFEKAKKELMEILPAYMVPTTILPVSIMPLTTSGKLDRLRLRSLAVDTSAVQPLSAQTSQPKVAPTAKTEKSLHGIWVQALNLSPSSIGVHDHFFRLGADSITAMRLVSLAKPRGFAFGVADIFKHPVLYDLAQFVATAKTVHNVETIVPQPFSLITQKQVILVAARDQYALDAELIEDITPCTPLQEGLMMLSIRDRGTYIGQEVYELPLNVDLSRFKQAWATVYENTAIWRTRFIQVQERTTYQAVMKDRIQWHHASSVDDMCEAHVALSMSFGDRLSHFGLVVDEPLGSSHFVFTAHHSLYDAWTMALTFKQVHKVYNGENVSPLLPLSAIVTQLTVDSSEASKYWSSYLHGVNSKAFPAPAPLKEGPRIDRALETALKCKLPDNSEWTAFTVVKAAWAILVHQYTACEDIVFGTPVSGRNACIGDIDRVCAPTIATIPVRAQIQKDGTIRDLLQRLQADAAETIPFEQTGLQNIRRINDDTRRACEFSCLLLMQAGQDSSYDYSNVFGSRRIAEDAARTNSYALTLDLTPVGDGFEILAGFDTNSLEEDQVQKILRQLEHLLKLLSSVDLSCPISDLLTVQHSEMLLIKSWNQRATKPSLERRSDDLFREQAAARPHHIAISSWDGENVTYKQLDEFSDRLAWSLSKHGIGSDDLVPLVFEKSLWTVVAMLGVLKAGGGFVCLDPRGPKERAEYICAQASAHVGLTSALNENYLTGFVSQSLVVSTRTMEAISERFSKSCKRNTACSPSDTMYVVFTSGSTGRPKGCVVEHRAYVTAAQGVASAHNMHSRTRTLQFSNYTFDVSIEDIFTTLLVGGCICVPSQDELDNGLSQAIARYNATHIELTPTVANLVDFDIIPSLRTVVIAGESASKLHVPHNIREDISFINSYGLSETAITNVATGDMSGQLTNNIGRPFACTAWIVDAANHDILLPLGAEGELLIGGPVLAREYLQQPTQTAESFIAAPTWAKHFADPTLTDGKFYKTGDLARFSPDGSITHLGRNDHQVKLRGLRIELNEIESHIQRFLPDYSNLVEVVEHGVQNTTTHLVAFLAKSRAYELPNVSVSTTTVDESSELLQSRPSMIRNDETAATHSQLRAKLAQTLPEYMVPSLCITIDNVPLNAAGKIDRQHLKRFVQGLSLNEIAQLERANSALIPPRTAAERHVQKLWADVLDLGTDSVGANDNFFRLGGDSLSAMRLVSVMRKQGYTIAVADVFRNPILAEFAKDRVVPKQSGELKAEKFRAQPFSLVTNAVGLAQGFSAHLKLSSGAIDDILPCTALQEGMMSHTTLNECSYTVYRLPRNVDLQRLQGAWELFVKSAPIWRTVIFPDDTGHLMQIVLSQPLHWYTASHLDHYLKQHKRERTCLGDPLSRLAVIDERSATGNLYLVLALHHAVHDTWSLSLALEAVCQLYKAHTPDVLVPFSEFIYHTMQALQKGPATYWKTYLDSFSQPMYPWVPQNQSDMVSLHEFEHSFQHSMSSSRPYTPTVLLRAAWASLISGRTGQRDVVFGTMLSGRNADFDGIDRCIGPTTAIVPCRIRIQQDRTAMDVLKVTQDDATEMIPFEHYGLHNISKVSQAAKAACAFSTLVVYHAQTEERSSEDTLGRLILSEGTFAHISHSLLLECSSGKDSVRFRLTFDDETLAVDAAKELLKELERVFVSLDCCDEFMLMGNLISFGPSETLQPFKSNPETKAPSPSARVQDLVRASSNVFEATKSLESFSYAHPLNDPDTTDLSEAFDLLPQDTPGVEDIALAAGVHSSLIEDAYPCTPLQQGLMLLSARDGSYLSREVFVLRSNVDPRRFQHAWNVVVSALPIWRTRIVQLKIGPMLQVVLDKAIDWQNEDVLDIHQYLQETPLPSMALAQELSHFTLAHQSSSGTTYFVLSAHHAVYDGISLQDTLYRVGQIYAGEDPGPSVPFKSFIGHLTSDAEHDAASTTFWCSYFSGIDATPFPPAPAANTNIRLNRTVRKNLGFTCKSKTGFTTFTTIKAAWALLIRQYTACDDVIFGTTLNGRNASLEGIEYIAGPTITSVPQRVNLKITGSLDELLEQVQYDTIAMMPFEQTGLQNIQKINADTRLGCQFNTLIVFQGDDDGVVECDVLERLPVVTDDDSRFSSYPLTLELITTASGLNVVACFETSALNETQVDRILTQFEHVLSCLTVSDGNTALTDLMQVNNADMQQIHSWNSQSIHCKNAQDACIHDIFTTTALQQPRAIAIDAWDGQLTYEQLDSQSRALSSLLVNHGVGAKSIVPLCFEKSMWMIVSMLAVLKAGGAFVNIDPQSPRERLRSICEQTEAKIGLISASQSGFFNGLGMTSIVADKANCDSHTSNGKATPSQPATPDNLAYVIFTSGSTGTPKGVAVEHKAYVANAFEVAPALGITSRTRSLQFAASTFDTSLEEIFTTLLMGGCVCVPSDIERNNDPARAISDYQATFADLTPSVAALIDYSAINSLHTLVLGGEMASSTMEQCTKRSIIVKNSYGVTEAAITNTVSLNIADRGPSNIGRPTGCAVWIVDPHDHNVLTPIGAEGEMLIEGKCLARGYLNQQAKTDEVFITDPIWALNVRKSPSQRRFYKTGDLVRYDEDGSLIYVRRKDSQVKLRGLRIELGEIETQIRTALPRYHIAADIVTSIGDIQKGTMLVAYLARETAFNASRIDDDHFKDATVFPASSLQEAREVLSQKLPLSLPSYMLPSVLIPLSHIPLNSSGKADRRKLKVLVEEMPAVLAEEILQRELNKELPESRLEARMQAIWSQTLDLDCQAIGRHDHFFHQGGDSIRAMQLVAAARAAGIKLTVAQVFQHPILRDLCHNIDHATAEQDQVISRNGKEADGDLIQNDIRKLIPNREIEAILEATDFQALAIYEHLEGNGGFLTYITISYDRKVDSVTVRNASQSAIEKNEILRTIFVRRGGRTYGVILKQFICAFQMCKTSSSVSDFCESLIGEDQLVRLRTGEPPLKFWFIEGGTKDSVVVRLSHAQFDGLSLPFFFQALQGDKQTHSSYTNEARPMSYYVKALKTTDTTPAVKFWRELLLGSSMASLPSQSLAQNQTLTASFAESTIPSLKQGTSGLTFATYLKAAWAMVLARVSGCSDVVFGHLVSGRAMPLDAIERVNGPCINFIPVRVNTQQSPEAILRQVREQQISAMPYENLGFETIFRECTNWPLSNNRHPRFSSIVQHQNLPDECESFVLHGAECSVSYSATSANVTDAWVISEPKDDGLYISIGYFKQIIDSTVIESLLKDLCRTLKSFDNI